jgi:hypothetical protein
MQRQRRLRRRQLRDRMAEQLAIDVEQRDAPAIGEEAARRGQADAAAVETWGAGRQGRTAMSLGSLER